MHKGLISRVRVMYGNESDISKIDNCDTGLHTNDAYGMLDKTST